MTTPTIGQITVHLDDDFFESLVALDPGKSQRVLQAVNLLRKDPDHPNLHLKRLRRELDHLWSMRAGRDVRVLLHRRGDTFIAIEAGMRRDIYDKAERGRFVVNPGRRFMGFVDTSTPQAERRRPLPSVEPVTEPVGSGVFVHWTDGELAEAGFTEAEVVTIRGLGDEYDLLSLPWPQDRVDHAVELVEITPETWRAAQAGTDQDHESRIRDAIATFGGLTGISPSLSEDELRRLAEAPIEDWMIFLHPDQRSLVEAELSGPARVRGAAGTGKTVVALHRAAALARHHGRDGEPAAVLFAVVVPSLVDVLAGLYSRLPSRVEGGVDFLSLEAVATEVLRRAGVEVPVVDPNAVDDAFGAAWSRLDGGDPVRRSGLTASYIRTEIEKVLKGRDLRSEGEYLSVSRTGRRSGLARSTRSAVWRLSERWDEELAARGTTTSADLVNRALGVLTAEAAPARYRAVVVDEAQDLTLAGLQLLRRLVNGPGADRPDGLFLVGDGAQRIQPGGFTLRQAGVEVRGRTSVLRVNYRNTAEIIDAALAALGEQSVADLDGEFRRGEQVPIALRAGGVPTFADAEDDDSELEQVLRWVEDAAGTEQVAPGDIAVLLPTPGQADRWADSLRGRGVETVGVETYEGRTTELAKIGTHAASKGLEFKVVVLPELDGKRFPPPAPEGETADEAEERLGLLLSHLFVAMTRARDLLLASGVGGPCQWVEGFEKVGGTRPPR